MSLPQHAMAADDAIEARLRAAEAAGIVSADQVRRMRDLWNADADGETDARPNAGFFVSRADAEEVRFARGFHDVFLSIGIVMVLFGLAYGLGAVWPVSVVSGVLAATVWVFSEIFARRMRLALPSFLLSLAFAPVFLFAGLEALASGPVFDRGGLWHGRTATAIVPALIGVTGALLHYWRFSVPVGAAGVAGTLLFLAAILLETALPGVLEAHLAWFTLAAGAATFIAAMRFDSRDVARVTAASDKAFWLHLLAAPLLVHSVLALVTNSADVQSGSDAAAVIALFAALALVAILVDRRALLVSGLGYFGLAIARLMVEADVSQEATLALTLGVLGCFILLLGSAWRSVRRAVARPFRSTPAMRFVPAVD
ncbi:hypothetical protein [Stappia stellulata]|uniref:hypothetical protein n=1 Tax=Stappia stellulata TaxID=71235 RepID=UPI000426889D|nr:hypothetical protein [Stappia stellulata]